MPGYHLVRQVILTQPLKDSRLTSALHSVESNTHCGSTKGNEFYSLILLTSLFALFIQLSSSQLLFLEEQKLGAMSLALTSIISPAQLLGSVLLWFWVSELVLGQKCDVKKLHSFPDFIFFALYPPFTHAFFSTHVTFSANPPPGATNASLIFLPSHFIKIRFEGRRRIWFSSRIWYWRRIWFSYTM